MIFFIDPFSVVILEDRAVKAERVNGNIFGGFLQVRGHYASEGMG